MKLFANKKGFLDNATDLLVMFILLLFGLGMISMFLFSTAENKNEASIDFAQGELIEQELVNFLKLPVDVAGQRILVNDLIISSANTGDALALEEIFFEHFTEKQQRAQLEVFDEASFNAGAGALYKLSTVKPSNPILKYDQRVKIDEVTFTIRDKSSITLLAKNKDEDLIVRLYVK